MRIRGFSDPREVGDLGRSNVARIKQGTYSAEKGFVIIFFAFDVSLLQRLRAKWGRGLNLGGFQLG